MSALAECFKQGYYYYEIQYFYLLIHFIFESEKQTEKGTHRERERESKRKWACVTHYRRAFKHEIQTTTITTASTLCKIPNININDDDKIDIYEEREKKK